MNTCKNFVDSIKNADFTGIFRLIMKEPSYIENTFFLCVRLQGLISHWILYIMLLLYFTVKFDKLCIFFFFYM